MISRDELVWLYRCILGRDPESEAHILDAIEADSDFASARQRFMASAEFLAGRPAMVRLQAHTANPQVHRHDATLGALRAVETVGVTETNRLQVPFGTLDPIIRTLGSRVQVQVALAVGGDTILQLALDFLAASGVKPAVLIKVAGDGSERDDPRAVLTASAPLPADVTLVERRDSPADVALHCQQAAVQVDLAIVAHAGADAALLVKLYEQLAQGGVLLVDLTRCAEAVFVAACRTLGLDLLSLGRFGLMQQALWMTPLVYWPEAAEALPPKRLGARLALAAIVGDGVQDVETMLQSCLPVIDFAAVVATGDAAARAAAVLTAADVPHVILREAPGDFAACRDAALAAVPEAYPWTLVLSDGEHLVPADYAKLLALLDSDAEGWALPRYNFHDLEKATEPGPYPDRQRRLFRTGAAGGGHWGHAPANLTYFGGGSGGPHIHRVAAG